MYPKQGQVRAVVRNVYPSLEAGRFFIKRVVGDRINVWADVFADGHDVVNAALRFKHKSSRSWSEVKAEPIGADRWHANFQVEKQGYYQYEFIAWVDYGLNWQYGIRKKAEAGIDVSVELLEGLPFLQQIKKKAKGDALSFVNDCIKHFKNEAERKLAIELACSTRLDALLREFPSRPHIATDECNFRVWVDREKAAFSTWYEFFPRSASDSADLHGNFKDCIKRLPRIADQGFDTLYFPPVHPIGKINRKGKNNATTASEGDVGSCWGIGASEGGHSSVHPHLGSMSDFEELIKKADKHGIEIAMDLALQCAPDHPWVKEHPEWFKQRPDGSIQYAENPPKKYQDIYPIYFETADWKNLWNEILNMTLFWVEKGIRVFRVDNPHTKPFGFWEWLIDQVHSVNPDILFLSEAFTKPTVMQELAALGFSQSYTYYTWRNSKFELIEYLNELTHGPQSEFFRPNFWPNTPDILPFALQNPSESIYKTRYFLAATLSSNCGVYGPVYEFMEHRALPGKEEYMDSEKYETRHWNWQTETPITELYKKINQLRKQYKVLQRTNNISFPSIENDQLIAYLKKAENEPSLLAIVNLNSDHTQSGKLYLHPSEVSRDEHQPLRVKDLLTGHEYEWEGSEHFISLGTKEPYHLFEIL